MALFETKYPNNQRTVSGTPELYQDDVTLNCDTSDNPVVINLLEIPDDKWNTQWKMYVNDASDNAGTNNITINAGTGQTINGQASITINANKASAMVQIVDNSKYICTLSIANSGAGILEIQDEGVALAQRNILNFTGVYVTASDDAPNNRTNADINPTILDVTNAEINALIDDKSLIKGLRYRIIDALGADLGVVLTAINESAVSTYGFGGFLNADYEKEGNYDVNPYTPQGLFYSYMSINQNDTVVWDNKNYVNTTGTFNPLLDPSTDNSNWTELLKSSENGYIEVWDYVEVSKTISNNYIVQWRTDKYLNQVQYEYGDIQGDFPWGNANFVGNIVYGNSHTRNLINKYVVLAYNRIRADVISNTIYTGTGFVPILIEENEITDQLYLENIVSLPNETPIVPRTLVVANQIHGRVRLERMTANNITNPVTYIFGNNEIHPNGTFTLLNSVNVDGGGNRNFVFQVNSIRSQIIFEGVVTLDGDLSTSFRFENNDVTGNQITIEVAVYKIQFNTINNSLPNPVTFELLGAINPEDAYSGIGCYFDGRTSTFHRNLDMDDSNVYNAGTQTLTIPNNQVLGRYFLLNLAGQTITRVEGSDADGVPFELFPATPLGSSFTINPTAIANPIAVDEIAWNAGLAVPAPNQYNITASGVADSIKMKRVGALDYNQVISIFKGV